MEELFINGVDAQMYGVTLLSDGVSVLMAAADMKEMVENTSRLEHGKHVVTKGCKLASRDITLTFGVLGKNAADYAAKMEAFANVLYAGALTLELRTVQAGVVYKLVYRKCTTYAQNSSRTFCKMAVKFTEPNPTDRTLTNEADESN